MGDFSLVAVEIEKKKYNIIIATNAKTLLPVPKNLFDPMIVEFRVKFLFKLIVVGTSKVKIIHFIFFLFSLGKTEDKIINIIRIPPIKISMNNRGYHLCPWFI